MQPEDDQWITAVEAATLLGVTRYQVCYLAQQHGWTRKQEQPGKKCSRLYFRAAQVQEFARQPERLRRRRKRLQRLLHQEANAPYLDEAQAETWISVREAAALLGVRTRQVNAYIESGRLMSRQTHVGQKGATHQLLLRHVEVLRDSPRRQERRRRYDKAGLQLGQSAEARDACAREEPVPDWLTTRQVAQWLGICQDRVRFLRLTGRIYAYERPRPRISGNAPRWMHRKSDVAALLTDPEYQKRRLAWDKAQDTRYRKALERTLEINRWNDPRHTSDYQASPGNVW